jgi:two-component system, NtrC family, sensor histidine kinase PilS
VNTAGAEKRAILLVEDDLATVELERRALVRAGREVRTSDRVDEAVAILRRDPILAVVLDYRLSDGVSWPVLEAAHEVVPRVPVIVVTAMGDERIAAEAIHRGAADYVIKSGDLAEKLPPAVSRVIQLAEAEQANARLASIVENSRDAIIGVTLDGGVSTWNRAAERLFGYSAGEARSLALSRLAPGRELAELVERARREEHGSTCETVGCAKDGREVELSVTVSPVKDVRARLSGLSVAARDITELKRMRDEVGRSQRLAALGEMAASIAHEIKNPLAAISAPLQVLLDGLPAGDTRRDIMGEILGQVNRLDTTVRNLLLLSKPWSPKKHPVVLRNEVERVAHFAGEHESVRGVKVGFEGGEGLVVPLDASLVEQVLWNLILNAAQSMRGRGEIRCAIRESSSTTIELSIADSGGGISPELLPKVFQPFVTSKPGGTGLGLAICRRIMEAHGGAIGIESQVGVGTTVRLRFPKS